MERWQSAEMKMKSNVLKIMTMDLSENEPDGLLYHRSLIVRDKRIQKMVALRKIQRFMWKNCSTC